MLPLLLALAILLTLAATVVTVALIPYVSRLQHRYYMTGEEDDSFHMAAALLGWISGIALVLWAHTALLLYYVATHSP